MPNKVFCIVASGICIAVNLVLSTVVQSLKIPLVFLDAFGTILGAVLFGPVYGGTIGLLTNVVHGFLFNPKDIPFALVNMVIGFLVGVIVKRYSFSLPVAWITGVLLALVAPLVGTPIAVWIYGGLTGGGTDIVFIWLLHSGQSIFSAAFFPRVAGNLIDKIVCTLLVYATIRSLPESILNHTNNSLVSGRRLFRGVAAK